MQLAIDLTRRLIKSEAVAKDRVYITGLSMGGMGTLEAVYRYPKIFAAAAPVCGGADEMAFKRKHVKIPFWLFHGDADQVVGVDHSREMVAKLKSWVLTSIILSTLGSITIAGKTPMPIRN